MPIRTAADFQIYDEYMDLGYTETVQQETGVFNAGSAGAIVLDTTDARGDIDFGSFFAELPDMISTRDPDSTADIGVEGLSQSETAAINVRYKTPKYHNTIDSYRRKKLSMQEHSMVLGEQFGAAFMAFLLNGGLSALVAAIQAGHTAGQPLILDATDGPLAYTDLSAGLQLFGDRQQRLVAIAGRSESQHDLRDENLSNYQIENAAGVTLQNGSVGTMNRPLVISDTESLINVDGIAAGTDSRYTSLLSPGALVIEEADDPMVYTDIDDSKENLGITFRAEGSINVGVKGYSWTGGKKPTLSDLASSANWEKVATSHKNTAGVLIETAH